ncbi:SAM-dependent methyltransferase [Planktothrix mougeotii]|uniref:SAM-dependent methyltransferase n=1 Tax=Planktothrix mougeotii LEGE 06226 TaxID=1828728 RepID=A0ABR9UGN6_9CYAN|nr:SAM-dependent methyltransferase [Planktothrix mougeotii]MBE9145630.1 SAM-dependent methyltransferase [Planktothrix mougeotii LEGE 06226]
MGLQLNTVIPWGRSFSEYMRMFDLTSDDLQQSILDCAAGPASFNVEMTKQGYSVISCDPIYQFSADEISQRIQDTYRTVIDGVKASYQDYIWDYISSPEQLGEIRMAAMEQFLADFTTGKQQGRYLTAELPQLPFNSQQFYLGLCSHFLFTYSDHFSQDFHLNAILELCRVAQQVRIFPLLKLSGEPSPFLKPIIQELKNQGYLTEIKTVNYEFQKTGNQMLKIQKSP